MYGNAARLLEVFLGVGVHEELVEFVSDAAAVLDGRHHVPHRLPRRRTRALRLHLQQVILRAAFKLFRLEFKKFEILKFKF